MSYDEQNIFRLKNWRHYGPEPEKGKKRPAGEGMFRMQWEDFSLKKKHPDLHAVMVHIANISKHEPMTLLVQIKGLVNVGVVPADPEFREQWNRLLVHAGEPSLDDIFPEMNADLRLLRAQCEALKAALPPEEAVKILTAVAHDHLTEPG